MNRQERRRTERQAEKDVSVLKKLPMQDLEKVSEIIDKVSTSKANENLELVNRSLTAILISKGWTLKETYELQNTIAEWIEEDNKKIDELGGEIKDMAKLQNEIKEFIKGLIGQGKGRKEVVEETLFKFPKCSKTMINNEFGKLQEELELEDAAAYILEDTKEIKKVVEKEEAKKIAKEVAKNLEKEIEKEVKEEKEMVKEKGLEIIEEVVVKTVKAKGINGVYEAKTGIGVALENGEYKLAFRNVEELTKFYNEYKKVFERI
ncbi:hypothetical protein ACQPUZ_04730 [Clostridium tertium]